MQEELHSVLAGVTAARHEQQEEQRKISQLKHQHDDILQVPHLHSSPTFCFHVTIYLVGAALLLCCHR